MYAVHPCCGLKRETDLILCPDSEARGDDEPCAKEDGAVWELPQKDMCKECWRKA
jgi:hypothetical protein